MTFSVPSRVDLERASPHTRELRNPRSRNLIFREASDTELIYALNFNEFDIYYSQRSVILNSYPKQLRIYFLN